MNMGVPKTPEEINASRKVYEKTLNKVGKQGLVERVANFIKGGGLSESGETLMHIDAELEDYQRKHTPGDHYHTDGEKNLLPKLQKSYLTTKLVKELNRFKDGGYGKRYEISGIIDGLEVEMIVDDDIGWKNVEGKITVVGAKIDGVDLEGDDALKLFREYEKVARLQDKAVWSHEQKEKSKESEQQDDQKTKSKKLVDKIL